jgi:hypothetical protein
MFLCLSHVTSNAIVTLREACRGDGGLFVVQLFEAECVREP